MKWKKKLSSKGKHFSFPTHFYDNGKSYPLLLVLQSYDSVTTTYLYYMIGIKDEGVGS